MPAKKTDKALKPARRKTSPPKERTKQETGLNYEQQAFVDELVSMERMVAWKAYQRVYRVASRRACETASSRMLRLVKIQRAIDVARQDRLKRVRFSQDEMFNHLLKIMKADVNEIVEYRRENCRHCHGIDHNYQWIDEAEYERTCAELIENAKDGEIPEMPDNAGGYGFDRFAMPNEDCLHCGGMGYGRTVIKDTRFLSPGARLLYAGMKESEKGIEAKTLDQLAVMKLLMQHMGMLDTKLTLKGDKENPLLTLLSELPGATLKPVED